MELEVADIINPHDVCLDDVRIFGPGKVVIGKDCQIRNFTVIELGNGVVTIGDNSVIGYGSFLQASGTITIGSNTLLGPHCVYLASTHSISESKPISQMPLIRGSVTIQNNVWLGANITVNCNVTIETGSIIGANSFVNKDIPAKQVWAGSPAKYIKDNG